MLNIFKKVLKGSIENNTIVTPVENNMVFQLKYRDLLIGILSFENDIWTFKYSEEFKEEQHTFNLIAGFSNIDLVYQSRELWPFFQSRIPGLKQPAVKEILVKEHINSNNKFELLKRFGKESIHNPYQLELL